MTLLPGTLIVAKQIDVSGALYQRRAAEALPLLIRQAEAGGVPINHEKLSRELGMPNPRNLNYVLGSIGVSLARLGETWKQPIPALQSLVTNKSTGLPGDGFVEFLSDPVAFRRATRPQQVSIIRKLAARRRS